ncbi:crotonobetaine/carnitine-CoA ligase [Enterobacillus tribolii]|uniref:Crotonobetaine/carnitine-CoA ligase n=1 Tax=Enterobacillus tribolii TaxID=1487935 RepID=A0A370R2E6_9GAMM|nr:crotonobetaine/carnitine-CoA ligase [Enterobacillus tribolii]MBW7983658.1 crotonobetaine/carnitine-CoA ligase [Enterobacillus tribolii]RDK96586.1 crotonobetaine/carnitine-CoA ligase [Enterobacillus tribolii]
MDTIGDTTLRDMWDERAARYGDKTALVYEDCAGNTREYSYARLGADINRAANLFLSLGIGKGDRVAVQIANSPEFVMCWYGLACIGAIAVPVNTQYTAGECEYLTEKCGVTAVVAEAAFLPLYRTVRHTLRHILLVRGGETLPPDVLAFETLHQHQPDRLVRCEPLGSDDVAEILFTSGTTSRPKGVVITHCNLLHAGRFTAWQVGITRNERYLSSMPAFHVDFQCSAAMPVFMMGATLILLEKYSARNFWRQVCLHRATLTHSMPLILRTLLLQPVAAWEKNHCLRDMGFYLNISLAEKARFEQRFNVTLFNSYGLSETLVGLIGDCPGDERHYPSIGRPGLGYEAKIADREGNALGPHQVGEIYVRGVPGRTLFREYYNDPQATQATLTPDGWMRTGDKGYVDERGLFYFVDRAVNVIKRSGENIASSEVETLLESHPGVAEAAVIGVPDPIRDEAVKAYIIVRDGVTLSEAEILDYCAAGLAKFKVPSYIEFVRELPRTCTGKVCKKQLKARPVLCEE